MYITLYPLYPSLPNSTPTLDHPYLIPPYLILIHSIPTLPLSDILYPALLHSTLLYHHSTLLNLHSTPTLSHFTFTLPHSTLSIPHSTPHTFLPPTLPHSTPTLIHLTLLYSTHSIPLHYTPLRSTTLHSTLFVPLRSVSTPLQFTLLRSARPCIFPSE